MSTQMATSGSSESKTPRAPSTARASREAQGRRLGRRKTGGRSRNRGLHARRAVISVIAVLAVWELAVRFFQPNSLIVVGPTAIVEAFIDLYQSGTLITDIAVSLRQFTLGFLLAAVVGVPLGLIMGASKLINDYADPWLTALYATPNIALAPLFIIWLGLGDPSHIVIIALAAFFPIIINTISGVQAVHTDLREVGIAYHANRRETFMQIDLPGSLPYINTGLRLAVARGLVGVVVADLFGSTAGLGHLILNASQIFRTADVFVGVVTLAVLGVTITWILRLAERLLTPWERSTR